MRIVGGSWGGRRIAAPPGRTTRPTTDRVREAWMSALAEDLRGADVVDLFAGSGALGLEALSRGAAHATFVENAPAALRTLQANVAALEAEPTRVRIVRDDALRYTQKLKPLTFDVAFADPPYGSGLAPRLCEVYMASPFASILGIEHATGEALPIMNPLRQRRYGDSTLTFLGPGS